MSNSWCYSTSLCALSGCFAVTAAGTSSVRNSSQTYEDCLSLSSSQFLHHGTTYAAVSPRSFPWIFQPHAQGGPGFQGYNNRQMDVATGGRRGSSRAREDNKDNKTRCFPGLHLWNSNTHTTPNCDITRALLKLILISVVSESVARPSVHG